MFVTFGVQRCVYRINFISHPFWAENKMAEAKNSMETDRLAIFFLAEPKTSNCYGERLSIINLNGRF